MATSLGLPLIDSTYAPDGPNQMNALANAVDTLLKSARKTGTGTITVPAGTAPNQDLAVSFGAGSFAAVPKVSIWSTGREGFTLSVVSGSITTSGFTANASISTTLGISHSVPFAWAVIDSPWQNVYT